MRDLDAKYILDKDGNVIQVTYTEWAAWYKYPLNKRIALTQINKDVSVSTVFLNMDRGYDEEGPPILFETLVFGRPMEGEMWRYSTKKEAQEHHKWVVKRVRKAIAKEESKWSVETTVIPRYYG